jgi:nicotinamidase-related amidase
MTDTDRFKIERGNSLFLLIDIQVQLFSVMDDKVRKTVENNTNLLIASMKVLNIPVVISEQYTKGLGVTVESIRCNLDDLYQPAEKVCFSCWDKQDIQERIRRFNARHIIIAGIETHVCVLQTTLDLLSSGYNVHVVSDAVCSRHKSDFKTGLRLLEQAGAVVTTTETVIFQLLKTAGTPEFKSISPLVRDR